VPNSGISNIYKINRKKEENVQINLKAGKVSAGRWGCTNKIKGAMVILTGNPRFPVKYTVYYSNGSKSQHTHNP
jgi:hypothetical protein